MLPHTVGPALSLFLAMAASFAMAMDLPVALIVTIVIARGAVMLEFLLPGASMARRCASQVS